MSSEIPHFDPGPFYDDNLVATIVSECLWVMKDYPARTKLTACYNLTERISRLFCVLGKKEDVLELINEFHEGLKKEIEKNYSD